MKQLICAVLEIGPPHVEIPLILARGLKPGADSHSNIALDVEIPLILARGLKPLFFAPEVTAILFRSKCP